MVTSYPAGMRSATDLRQRWLEELPALLTQSGLYATNGRDMQAIGRSMLGDLCYVDERDKDYEEVLRVLGGFGTLGVNGPFAALFGRDGQYTPEVASVLAEQFHRLGYLDVNRLLDLTDWEDLTSGLRERYEEQDVRRSQIEAAFGPPSLVIEDRVLCYVPVGSPGWVFFDCSDESHLAYLPGAGQYERMREADPLIRDIRIPADDFDSGLILTLYGKVLRWGPGWWIQHPSPRTSEASLGVASLHE